MKRIFLALFVWLVSMLGVMSYSQSAVVLSQMEMLPNSNAVVAYNNEFGHKENKELDETFPYAIVRMELEGDANDVKEAKKSLRLDLGRMYTTEELNIQIDNQILFLVPRGVKNVFLLCGDGCEKQPLYSGEALHSNKVYVCKVRYYRGASSNNPASVLVDRQYLIIKVQPPTSNVMVDGEYVVVENGVANKKVTFGKHTYYVEAANYHSMTDVIIVDNPDSEKIVNVALSPAFGYLTVDAAEELMGASVLIDKKQVGTIPLSRYQLASGTHSLMILKSMYKTYEQQITIEDEKTLVLNPQIEANFATLTLKASDGVEIWINNEKKAVGSWTGRLENDEYVFETRRENHRPVASKQTITSSTTGVITLEDPIPIYGSLDIDVKPAGSNVYLDDQLIGTTPKLIQKVLIGKHTLRVSHAGMRSDVREVVINEAKVTTVEAKLSKEMNVLSVRPNVNGGHCIISEEYDVIGANLFEGCKYLRTIAIAPTISAIGASAFSGCYQLTAVTIPQSVKTIESKTFYWCAGLKDIVVPEGVTTIGDNAFTNCYGLESVTLPSTLTSVAGNAFTDCKSLKTIYIPKGTTAAFRQLLPSSLRSKLKEK